MLNWILGLYLRGRKNSPEIVSLENSRLIKIELKSFSDVETFWFLIESIWTSLYYIFHKPFFLEFIYALQIWVHSYLSRNVLVQQQCQDQVYFFVVQGYAAFCFVALWLFLLFSFLGVNILVLQNCLGYKSNIAEKFFFP